jgi:hypothetical protein
VGVAGSSIVIGAVVLNYFDTKTIDTGPSPLSGTGYFDRAASVAIFLINYAISNPLVVIIFLFYVAAAINDYFYAKTQPLLKVHAEMARVMDRVLLFWIAFIFSMAAVVFSLAGPGLVFICARVVLDTLIAKKRTLMK